MEDFKEVSLGFAEFVAQLIHETFDAVLSSQNYQLEKYAELNAKLALPNELFIQNYVTSSDIESRMTAYFGYEIKKQMIVNEELVSFLNETFETNDNLVYNKKLTEAGYNAINAFIANSIVTEQKERLNTLINKSNMTSLVVDSGEITAKLELSSRYAQEKEPDKTSKPAAKLKATSLTKTNVASNLTSSKAEFLLPSYKKAIKVYNQKDEVTGKPIILIDKSNVEEINNTNIQIPNLRLTVQPTKLTTTSNLYSEVKINFKTI